MDLLSMLFIGMMIHMTKIGVNIITQSIVYIN
jgi:hypothetical protein